jgi:hypothetical protein
MLRSVLLIAIVALPSVNSSGDLVVPLDVLMVTIPSDTAIEYASTRDKVEPTAFQCKSCEAKDYAEKLRVGAQREMEVKTSPKRKLKRTQSSADVLRNVDRPTLQRQASVHSHEIRPEFDEEIRTAKNKASLPQTSPLTRSTSSLTGRSSSSSQKPDLRRSSSTASIDDIRPEFDEEIRTAKNKASLPQTSPLTRSTSSLTGRSSSSSRQKPDIRRSSSTASIDDIRPEFDEEVRTAKNRASDMRRSASESDLIERGLSTVLQESEV